MIHESRPVTPKSVLRRVAAQKPLMLVERLVELETLGETAWGVMLQLLDACGGDEKKLTPRQDLLLRQLKAMGWRVPT